MNFSQTAALTLKTADCGEIMCGICGKLYFANEARVDERVVQRMTDVLAHRGPNERGCYVNRNLGLGHRRLSIIDLTTGQQPMQNQRRDLAIVFNGEIYNFPHLRKNLEKTGYQFQTQSDTEVILHLYDAYGAACVEHLRGMFAFAIWDQRRQRLMLARDRVGQKPLFYAVTSDALLFASEIKSLLQDPSLERQVNLSALSHYLTYQYVPPPETIFRGISKLPPAHRLICERRHITIERYWDLPYGPKMKADSHEIRERLETLFSDAVAMRMISDVPLGAFLSGGIDSSLVVAFMAHHSSRPVKTFSIGFEDKVFNELPYARLVAERYQTEHHEYIVKPDALAILPKLIWHFDEPFGDSSAIPTYYLAQMTGQSVKVALNGDGGDESFAGYLRYLGYTAVRYYRMIPENVRRKLIGPFLAWLAQHPLGQQYLPVALRRAQALHQLSLAAQAELYLRTLIIFDNAFKSELLTPEARAQAGDSDSSAYTLRYFQSDQLSEITDRMLYADVMTYLPGDLLVKIDRMTMAHGLEGRSPFLDHRLLEFAAVLPADQKLRGTCLKYALKKLGKPWLPDAILSRPKQGFGVPIGKWFQHELRDMVQDLLASSVLARDGILNQSTLNRLWREHCARQRNHAHRIWSVLNLELWYRMFIRQTL